MITKYDMTSGGITYQSNRDGLAANETRRHGPVDLATSLQLIELEVRTESPAIPADLVSISVSDFLNTQG